jgi:hypothetical protein
MMPMLCFRSGKQSVRLLFTFCLLLGATDMPAAEQAGDIDALNGKQSEQLKVAQSVADPARVHSRGDLINFSGLFDSLLRNSRELAGKLKEEQKLLTGKMIAAGGTEKDSAAAINALIEQDRRYSRLIGKAQADAEWAETMLNRFRLMKEYWNQWKIADDGQSVISDDQEFSDDFGLLTRRANAIRSLDALSLGLPECQENKTADAKSVGLAQVLSAVTGYWNGDGSADRAVLIAHKPDPEEDELVFSELYLFLSDAEHESMPLALHKKNPAWSGDLGGTLPHLEIDRHGNLVIVSQNDAIGRDRWQQWLTIAYKDGEFVVAGFHYEATDSLRPKYRLQCNVDLFAGSGIKNGKQLKVRKQTIALMQWNDESAGKYCGK